MPTNNKDITKWSNRDLYTRIVDTFGMPHVKRRYKQEEEASKYTIPYIPEKEVMLTTGRYNTGKISTNLLDSIYDSSKRTGVPLDIALGLAGRESTLGIGRGFREGQDVTATDLYSNWQQIQQPAPKSQVDKWNNTVKKEKRGEALTENDYADRNDFLIGEQQRLEQHKPITEHPIDNALKFYQTGKYNPGDKNHSKMVEEDGKALMSDPAIQKWLKTKTGTQMKCGGKRKAQLGLDIREGGVAIPIANNMFYIDGRKHAAGGVAIGPNNKNGVEVEGGEVVEMIDSKHPSVGRQFKAGGQQQTMRVFSSVPFLRGASPAELVLGGANPDAVFKAQEEFKDRNRINDDGTRYKSGGITSEPSVKGTTKVTSKPSSTARGRGTKASTPKTVVKTTPTLQDTVNKITTDAWKASKSPKIKIDESKMPSYNVSDLGSKETKEAKAKLNTPSTGGGTQSKNTPWIGQYKTFRPEDWAGLGTNLAGHIAGYFANNSLLKKYPMPVKPVLFQAAKLKTTHNINPKLATSRETEQMNLAEVGRNTSSSSTSIARKQRIMNEARDARNKLYGEKENIETQLINLDKRNRQDVYNRNISAYNDWLDKTYIAKTNKLLEKQKNMMSLINGIPSVVNHTLGVIETRRNANNAYRAIAAANPNVDARQIGGFDYYEGIGPDGTHKALYDKHQRFVRYI